MKVPVPDLEVDVAALLTGASGEQLVAELVERLKPKPDLRVSQALAYASEAQIRAECQRHGIAVKPHIKLGAMDTLLEQVYLDVRKMNDIPDSLREYLRRKLGVIV